MHPYARLRSTKTQGEGRWDSEIHLESQAKGRCPGKQSCAAVINTRPLRQGCIARLCLKNKGSFKSMKAFDLSDVSWHSYSFIQPSTYSKTGRLVERKHRKPFKLAYQNLSFRELPSWQSSKAWLEVKSSCARSKLRQMKSVMLDISLR